MITNGPCISNSSVTISFPANPTPANAGVDQNLSCGISTVTLAANTPVIGTGSWSVITGAGGGFADVTDPATTFAGAAGTAYTLRWTISHGPCISTDDINVDFNGAPTTANAGSDQTGFATCGLTTVTLAANAPVAGTGNWTVIAGVGGSFADVANPSTTFSGVAGTAYTMDNYQRLMHEHG